MEFIKRDPVIFLIAGKANSGKDTSAEFIDNYVKLKGLKVVNLQLSSYIKMYAKKISGWNGRRCGGDFPEGAGRRKRSI